MFALLDVVKIKETVNGKILTGVITGHTKYLLHEDTYQVRPSNIDYRYYTNWHHASDLEKCTVLTEEDKKLKNELAAKFADR